MEEITLNSVVESLKAPVVIGVGASTGLYLQKKIISKLFNNETVQGLLGADATNKVANFTTPILTALGGVLIAANVQDKTLKNFAIGIAASGGVKMADNLIFKNQFLQGLLGSDTDVEQAVLEAKQDLKAIDYDLDGIDDDDDLDGIDDDDDLDGIDDDDELEGIDDDDELEGIDDDDELEGVDLS